LLLKTAISLGEPSVVIPQAPGGRCRVHNDSCSSSRVHGVFSGSDGNFLPVSEAAPSRVPPALCRRDRETALPLVRHSLAPAPGAECPSTRLFPGARPSWAAVAETQEVRQPEHLQASRQATAQGGPHARGEDILQARRRLHPARRGWQWKSCPVSEARAETECLGLGRAAVLWTLPES